MWLAETLWHARVSPWRRLDEVADAELDDALDLGARAHARRPSREPHAESRLPPRGPAVPALRDAGELPRPRRRTTAPRTGATRASRRADLANPERRRQDARVREDAGDVLRVLRLLVVGDLEPQAVRSRAEAARLHADLVAAVRRAHAVAVDRRPDRVRIDPRARVGRRDEERGGAARSYGSATRSLGGAVSFTQNRNVNRPAPARVALSNTIAYSPRRGARAAGRRHGQCGSRRRTGCDEPAAPRSPVRRFSSMPATTRGSTPEPRLVTTTPKFAMRRLTTKR